jgi:hypothetical protein
MDIVELTHSLAYGNPIADAASMLCRGEDEVRQKAKERGASRASQWRGPTQTPLSGHKNRNAPPRTATASRLSTTIVIPEIYHDSLGTTPSKGIPALLQLGLRLLRARG